MARIKMVEYPESTGRLKEIYNEIIEKRGKLAEVHKIQSLHPESIVNHMDLYLEIMFSRSELSRAEREMMAVIVSVANGCDYCRLHHSEALNHYWKSDDKITMLIKDFNHAGLSQREILLCGFARKLTEKPEIYNDPNSLIDLKNLPLSDSAILDATLVVAYFNFVNRIVLALGVESSAEEVQGYRF
ncbi:MAG: peroxidase-related enzyme [Bacteroidales bacterium]|nr:peroxidase-related enzyme [Bacteroidales bacterium]